MKKKVVSMLLTICMVLSMCACGSTGGTKESETKVSESKESSTAVSSAETEASAEEEPGSLYPLVEEPVTVKAVFVGNNPSDSESRIVWDKVSEITGINIEWEVVDAESIATYLAGGDWPDFIHANLSSTLVYDYGTIGGRFVNFLDHLDQMPNLVQAFEDYPVAKKGFTEVNGEMYKLPGIEVSVTGIYTKYHVLTDVLDEAGVEMPTTVEEFEQALRDLKDYYGTPSWIPRLNVDKSCWGSFIYTAFGTDTDMVWNADENGNVVYAGSTDQMRHYYEYMNSLYEQGLIHQECATMDNTVRQELELSGTVAFPDQAAAKVQPDENGEYHIACMAPLTSEYDDTQEVMGALPIYNNFSIYINNDSEYVNELCQMMDIMYATEEVVEGSGLYGASFCYGLEGVHWEYGEEGSGVYSMYCPEEYGSFNTYQYAELIWQNSGRCDAFAGLVTDTVGNSQARQLAYVEGIHPYIESDDDIFPRFFLKFTDDEQYVIDSKWTEIETYVKKMQVEFITGVTDIETGWDEYCETLKKMGIEDVTKVYQQAYDRWCSY